MNWLSWEDKYLERHWRGPSSIPKLMADLNRTRYSIQVRASILGVTTRYRERTIAAKIANHLESRAS